MKEPRRYPLGDYGLGWVLLGLFASSLLGHHVLEWLEFVEEEKAHGLSADYWSADFWTQFGRATLENWQSEFLQLFAMVALGSFLAFRNAQEARSTKDEQDDVLDRIVGEVDGLYRRFDEVRASVDASEQRIRRDLGTTVETVHDSIAAMEGRLAQKIAEEHPS